MDRRLKESLDRIFFPSSVAVAGVSRDPDSPGTLLLRSLLDMGFEGNLYPVNPRYEEVMGLKCYPSISSLPEGVDLAILSVPPTSVPQLVEECARSGVAGCVVNTAGFSETGREEGRLLEARIVKALESSTLRLVGPNCMGIYSSRGKVALFAGMFPAQGRLCMISQSGSLASITFLTALERGLTFDRIVSSGNELDLNCADFLEYFLEDPEVEMVLAYLEEIRDARRFLEVARRARGKTPIIVMKGGRTAGGKRAASSHTAAMGGSYEILGGALRQAGIIQVNDLGELLDVATALHCLPRPRGRRVAVVSSPGGLAVNAADAVEEAGLELADLAPSTVEEIREILPAEGTSPSNPVDLGFGAVRPGVYSRVLETVAADPSVDIILAVGSAPASRKGDPGLLNALTDEMIQAKAKVRKPVVAVFFPGSFLAPQFMRLHSAGIPAYPTPTSACRSLAQYIRFHST